MKFVRGLTIGSKHFLELECHSAQGDHSFVDVRLASKNHAAFTQKIRKGTPLVFGSLDGCGRKE